MKTAAAIRTTCPRDCYDACGVLVKTSEDGTINVVGDPDHDVSRGALCGKCSIGYNGVWRDPNVRLTRPLKRFGPKGLGHFQPVSWDEALGDIADRLNTIRSRDGGSAILQTHYTGTCSLIAGTFPLRFFNRIGATEVDPDTVCNKAGHVALQLMYGEFDARLRPAHHRWRAMRADLGRQSIGVGAACAPTLAWRDGRAQDRRRSYPPRDGGGGRYTLATIPGHRRRARLCDVARYLCCGPHRSDLPRCTRTGLGRDRMPVTRLHPGMG